MGHHAAQARVHPCGNPGSGTSPYLASHFLGHFELLAAWPLPAFAWAMRHAFRTGSKSAVAAASVVLIATAYTTYYYVVYLVLLALAYFIASPQACRWRSRPDRQPRAYEWRSVLIGAMAAAVTLILWILATGGAVVSVRSVRLSLTGTHNPLAVFWFLSLCLLLTSRRIVVHFNTTIDRIVPGAVSLAMAAAAFVIGTTPLLVQAIQLVRTGQYVSYRYLLAQRASRGRSAVAAVRPSFSSDLSGFLSAARCPRRDRNSRVGCVDWRRAVCAPARSTGRREPTGRGPLLVDGRGCVRRVGARS